MLTKVHSVTTLGLKPLAIDVEIQSTTGIPQIVIIGLVNTSVREAKDRIVTALKHLGIRLKSRRTIVSLTPADIKKSGSSFDLAIAVGLVSLYRTLNLDLTTSAFLGEVSLDGSVRTIEGCFAKVLAAQQLGFTSIYIPHENLHEVMLIKGIKIYGVKKLTELLSEHPQKYLPTAPDNTSLPPLNKPDRPKIVGQLEALRALTIAVAGKHNLHFTGPPGVGKTIFPKVAQYLYPPLSQKEATEVLAIHSFKKKMITTHPYLAPFRSPHHSASLSQLVGNSSHFTPGELSLAHNGILFLDELPEFKNEVLQALRIPLEAKKITLTKQTLEVELPSNCLVLGSSNPCPCGYWQTGVRSCKCTAAERGRYTRKLSGPLLERFDLHVTVNPLTSDEYKQSSRSYDFISAETQIRTARSLQVARYQVDTFYNSDLQLEHIHVYCKFDVDSAAMLKTATTALRLSTRAYQKIVSVAQTIADLEESPVITEAHCAEALNYRFENSWQSNTY